MIISKGTHKAFIFNLFYPLANGGRQERHFPLDKLMDAASFVKKLKDSATEQKDGDAFVGYQWGEDELSLSEGETKLLRELMDGIKEATPSQFLFITEIKELLT